MIDEILYFHINPPEKGVSRATFAGIIENNQLRIGIANCSKKDQFNKKIGRRISSGRARKSLVTIPFEENNKTQAINNFISFCKEQCEIMGLNHEYPRKKKNKKQFII